MLYNLISGNIFASMLEMVKISRIADIIGCCRLKRAGEAFKG
jgi:hypothetical protein